MLNRNCAITNLLREGDFNVRVTVFDHSTHTKGAWIEIIRDSIGGGIVNSTERIKAEIIDENGRCIVCGILAGNNIANIIDAYCKDPIGLRITLTKLSDRSKVRTWIIV